MHKGPLLWRLSISTLLLGITTTLNYVLFIIFARVGGVEVFSQYLYDLTMAGVLSVVVNYSSQRVYTHNILETGSEQNSFNVIMTTRAILGSLSLVGIVFWGYWSPSGTPFSAVFLVFYTLQLNFLFEYFATNVQLAVITLIEKAVFFVTAGTWVLTVGFTSHVYGFFLLSSILALALQARIYPMFVRDFNFSSPTEVFRYFKRYIDLVLIDIVQLTYGNFSRLIIQQKNGLLDFGAVSISFQIIKVVSIFQTQAESVFRPQTLLLSAKGDSIGLRRHSIQYLLMTTFPTVLTSLTLILFSKPLILVGFGKDYVGAIPALQVISILPITINLMRYVETVCIGLNLGRLNLMVSILTCFLLLMCLALVPAGSALVVFLALIVAAQIFYLVTLTVVAAKRMKHKSSRQD